MFTKKPESGESITKMGSERTGELKTPFTERPATYASKSPSPAASKMVPSIIGEDLSITGNVNSKGEIQVDGEIQGDIHCGSLLLGDKSQVIGGVMAEDVVVRGRVVGSIRGLRVTLQAQSHVEGDIFHQSLRHRAGCVFRGQVAPLRQSTDGSQSRLRKRIAPREVRRLGQQAQRRAEHYSVARRGIAERRHYGDCLPGAVQAF